jgi:hypothetical protein
MWEEGTIIEELLLPTGGRMKVTLEETMPPPAPFKRVKFAEIVGATTARILPSENGLSASADYYLPDGKIITIYAFVAKETCEKDGLEGAIRQLKLQLLNGLKWHLEFYLRGVT